MIDTKALREKILDLAIRGKLVPQDPNDEPASVLLERIRAQKQQMVKEGKLKAKDIKNDTIIFKGEDNLHYEQFQDGTVKCIEDEIPFDVPDGWAWTRLGVICPYGTCEKVETKNIADNEWILDLEDIEKDTGLILKHITKKYRSAVSTKHRFLQGQLLYSKLRPYLNKVVIADQDGYCTSEILPLDFWGGISPLYMQIYLMSATFLSYVNMISYGVKMPRLGTKDGEKVPIALPPLRQQVIIAKKTRECLQILLSLTIEKDNLKNLIEIAKSKILDLAIRGKLVPQDPNDEPASLLLERIKAEKEELIKQGKIKRDKKESVIFKGEDNSYYQDLPENWELVAFSDIATLISGRDLKSTEYNSDMTGIPYITGASNFNKGKVLINRWTTSPKSISIKNDILLTCKGTVGELAINNHDKIHIARQIMAIRIFVNINLQYIKLFFESKILEIKKSADGLIPGISRDDILSLNIPLPPLAEQCRIVQAIKSSFAQLDEITNSIS